MSEIVAVAHTLAQTLEKQGGGISERQWNDLLSVLKVQANTLDYDYLRHWAAELGIADLLLRAFDDAGIIPTSAK
jgi:hypothetical protein